jgi:hypothetical protein
MLRFDRAVVRAPEVCPQLSGDYLRLSGETFAQAWRNHIEQSLNPDIFGDQAESPTSQLIY